MPSYGENDFKQSNVNYLNKDFGQLKASLINYAKAYFPDTYRDFNESSPGMMLMEMSAYVGDVLSFYIDKQYQEMLLPLAEERRNVLNMAKMFGYQVKPIVPAHVDLTIKSQVNSVEGAESTVDYSDAAIFDAGIQVTSTTNTNLIFETLEPVDFTITGSTDLDTFQISDDTGLITSYTLSRTVKAVSGETKTRTFLVGAPTKFLKLKIPETNVIDIISCIDKNGNDWYEVDFLAQDKVPIKTHYTQDSNRDTAYVNLDNSEYVSEIAVPYSLRYIKTSKRFVRETNDDNTTSLVFGNGVLRDGATIDEGWMDLEQIGVVIPGQSNDINEALDPLLGDDYSTLGETPIQTTLTITYRVGGGIDSNAAVGDLTQFTSPAPLQNNGSADATIESITNELPAVGGRDEETIDEIKERTKAFFTTQHRCVTKEDYEARTLNIPSKFGNIAKAYVSRTNVVNDNHDISSQISILENFITEGITQLTAGGLDEGGISTDTDSLHTSLGATLPVCDSTGELSIPVVTRNLEIDLIDSIKSQLALLQTSLSGADNQVGLIPTNFNSELGKVNINILAYDRNNNLVGNRSAAQIGVNDNVPDILKQNIKSYIDNFRLLTDMVHIQDGFIINFGVFFDVIAHRSADRNAVKLRCIQAIKDYFRIDKMQFSQPIFVSKLESELMQVDGVMSVNYVTISQDSDYNAPVDGRASINPPLYHYSFDPDLDNLDGTTGGFTTEGGTEGYGYKYEFETALLNGVIIPPSPQNPGVFELKNPNQNIRGVVR